MKVSRCLFLLLLLSGCLKKVLVPAEYIAWVDDRSNGMIQEREENGLLIEVKYKPVDYMILQVMGGEYTNKAEYDSLKKKFEGFSYYNMRLSSKEQKTSFIKAVSNNDEDVFRLKEYFYFHFNDNIYLEVGDKRIPCSLYHFEDTYELSKYETVVLGFKDEDAKDIERRLVIDSDVLRTGIIKFTFSNKVLNKIPDVKVYN